MSARKRSKAPQPTAGDAATTIEALNGELAAARAARDAEQAAAKERLRAIQAAAEEERRRAEERLRATLRATLRANQDRLHAADQRIQEVERRLLHQHRQQGHVGLTGLAAVEGVFHFLPDPADALRAATACRRWRELAGADSVWRARFEREGLVDKARLFELALPPVPVQGGAAEGGGGGNSTSTASERDELAGVGLAFYAQVFALKVRGEGYNVGSLRGHARASGAPTYPSHHRSRSPPRRGLK